MPLRMSTQSPGQTADRQRGAPALYAREFRAARRCIDGFRRDPAEWLRDNLPCLTKECTGRRFRWQWEVPGSGRGSAEIGDLHAQ